MERLDKDASTKIHFVENRQLRGSWRGRLCAFPVTLVDGGNSCSNLVTGYLQRVTVDSISVEECTIGPNGELTIHGVLTIVADRSAQFWCVYNAMSQFWCV